MKAPGAAIDFETDTVHRKRLDTTIPLHQTAAGQYEAADPHILGASAERRGREGASLGPRFSVGPGRSPHAGRMVTGLFSPPQIVPLAVRSGFGEGLSLGQETGWDVNRKSGYEAMWKRVIEGEPRVVHACLHAGSCQSRCSAAP